MKKIVLLLPFAVVLTSCGGGTSNSTVPSGAPVITTQPAPQTVTVGQTAVFKVAATGAPPLAYEWSQSTSTGTVTATGSATYTTAKTTAADNGDQVSVVVSNSAGSVPSAVVGLTVTSSPPPPGPTVQSVAVTPASADLLINQTQTFIGVVTYSDGTTDQNVQWSAIGAGTINSSGVFTPNALGTATVIAAATADTSISMAVPVTVSNFISGKYGGALTPDSANSGQGSYYWSFDLDQNSSGALTGEPGVNILSLAGSNLPGQINLAGVNLATPAGLSISGTEPGTNVQMTVSGNPADPSNNGPAVLTGTESQGGGISGTFTNQDSNLGPYAGTFTLTRFGLLSGTWSGTTNLSSNSTLTLTLSLDEVAPTSTTSRQFSGQMTLTITNSSVGCLPPGGCSGTFSGSDGVVQGDLFEILVDTASPSPVPCQVIAQMADVAGSSLLVYVNGPNAMHGSCPLPPSQAAEFYLSKQ